MYDCKAHGWCKKISLDLLHFFSFSRWSNHEIRLHCLGLVQLPHNVILQGTVMGLPLLLCTFVSPIKEGISGSLVKP